MLGWVSRTSACAVMVLFASCISAPAQDYPGREKLRAQSAEFRKEVILVTDGVYVAVGYSASNVILIQGDAGSIIVDTATDPVAARAVRTAFGDLLRAPVRAIIYTHSHPDHTGGARVFAGKDHPEIISHQPFGAFRTSAALGAMAATSSAWHCRIHCTSTRAFKWRLGGSRLPLGKGYLPPTRTFSWRPTAADDCRRETAASVYTRRDGGYDLGLAA